MGLRNSRSLLIALLTLALVIGSAASVLADPPAKVDRAQQKRYAEKMKKAEERIDRVVTQKERDVAASNLAKKLNSLGLAADAGPAEYFAAMEMAAPGPGDVPDYSGMTPNWAYTPPLQKFVDGLPGLGPDNANNLGQFLSVGKPDTVTYPGADYYEIELRQYTEQMHTDLPPTTLRGYVQTNLGTDASGNNTLVPDPIHYLGPTIIATKDRPVRIKFTNKLPNGEDGNLFIPVDTTVMGAGMGPLMHDVPAGQPMNYTENRATLHLHGGRNPWISDGTPHQWITPAGENTPYPEGVSVREVPDMPGYDDPSDGVMTFYYSNAQSARLMFYHDHSYGITRLNVYAGEAAGYIIEDDTEKQLVADGTIPAEQIPLIIQDKTFVDAATITATDPTWNWGTGAKDAAGKRLPHTGDLWMAHVYMPNQNPYDLSGYNAMGRWHYGPWFWPPVVPEQGPIPNPYYVDPVTTPGQPPMIPGVPHPSMGMESFFDTPLVNGTAYPVLEVDPKAYRFRVLNAANDRFWNLQLYEADPAALTEVRMVPAEASAVGAYEGWEADGRVGGLPDPTLVGPDMIQIANEGGFLPSPVVLKSAPIQWNTSVVDFNVGNVDGGTLMLGPAERADVIVDFSAYAGKTLILYNDAPAPWPAIDSRYDYYTGNEDLTDAGGHAPTLPGYGPNTRTIMQIKVAATGVQPAYDLAALEAAFHPAAGEGVFRSSQEDVIVAQEAYSSAYNGAPFSGVWPDWGIVRIFDKKLDFKTVDGTAASLPLQAKAIQDEMGETFDLHYGRMAGKLGLELPNTIAGAQNFMLYGYDAPPTEIVESSVASSKIGELGDGTQIWKITQNGVDTHPMHFHLFEVQLLNRVAWDGKIMLPELNELGWKDTVKVNPLEDTIVALRPVVPEAPWDLPNSVRMLDPTMPEGAILHGNIFDPMANPVNPVANHLVNFGWEYVWHCHILSHEEMDMMRPMSVVVKPRTPSSLAAALVGGAVNLTWADNSLNETGFVIERARNAAFTSERVSFEVGENVTVYSDASIALGRTYYYRVFAKNVVGDTFDYKINNPQSVGFPAKTAISGVSNSQMVTVAAVLAPSGLTGSAVPQGPRNARVTLNWVDNSSNETGFTVQWATNPAFTNAASANVSANATTYRLRLSSGVTYYFRVRADNRRLQSAWSNTFSLTTP